MAEQYRSGPDRSVERAAIGRRTSECQVDCVNLLIPGPLDPPTPEVATVPEPAAGVMAALALACLARRRGH